MYKAVVCKIKTQEIPGADNIKLGYCLGYQVIVSKDTEDDQLGVFFEQDGCLTKEFASINNLFRHSEFNLDKDKAGYFEDNARVKSLKLKLAKSDGFWCPLSFFAFTGVDLKTLREGDEFDTLNNIQICKKYYSPATLAQMRRDKNKQNRNLLWKTVGYCKKKLFNSLQESVNFPEHYDTMHFKRSYKSIIPGSRIIISSKQHGTSGRIANAKTKKEIYKWKIVSWFMKLIGKPTIFDGFSVKYGSRRVILKDNQPGFYGSNQFRYDSFDAKKLKVGEAVYGEIVGFLPSGASIMDKHSTKHLKDKKFSKLYGDEIIYSYGCKDNENKFFIYNIKSINEKGIWYDLPYEQMTARAAELGHETPHVYEIIDNFDGDHEALFKKVQSYVEDETTLLPLKDPIGDHIQEGVVVRTELNGQVNFYKSKSTAFGLCEGYLKENDEYVDLEESS